MNAPTSLKVITTKNRQAVEAAIQATVGTKGFVIDQQKATKQLMVVTSDNEKYFILVGYDQAGKSVYSLKRYYTDLELAQQFADAYTADRILGSFLKKIGSNESNRETIQQRLKDLGEVSRSYDLGYYSKRVAEWEGHSSMAETIHSINSLGVEEGKTSEKILEEIMHVLMMTSLDWAQYERWSKGNNDMETVMQGTRAKRAAEWYKELMWGIRSMNESQLKLANLESKEG